jgi:hypothetical protein
MTSPNPHAHLPTVPDIAKYRLGPDFLEQPDDAWFNLTYPDGTQCVAEEPEGWEGLEYVTPIDTVGGRDGGLDGPQSIAPRELPIKAMMVSPDSATLRRRIKAIRAVLRSGRVLWEQYDFAEAVRMGLICRPSGDFRATPEVGSDDGGVAVIVTFTLVAANPPWKMLTGAAEFIDIGLPVDVVSGRTYNKTYSYNYGAVLNPGGIGQAVNRGDRTAYPLLEITGPANSPIISNETTGRSFVVLGNIPALTVVRIDSRNGNVTPASYRLVGRPWALEPGVNNIRWRASSGSFDPNANLRVIWRSTWE